MTRILHLYKDYYPVLGGIENHIRVLAEAQARRGHAVTVLVTNRARATVEERLNGVRVVKAGRLATLASTPVSTRLWRELRGLQPDLTHLHSPYPVGEIAQWLAGRERPYVVTYHADATRPVQRAIMRVYGPLFLRFLRRADRVLATSANYAASSPYLRRLGDRVDIVPLGVDSTSFAPAPSGKTGRPALLFVGAMRHYKGLGDLLRAMPHVRAEARLLLAGEGPMRAEWEALSRSLGLGERVRFLGRVADDALPGLYQSADIFVLPASTRAEAFGTVLLEAMASGLPCVTTEVGSGTSYVVEHGVTGWVTPPHAPAALAEAVNALISDAGLRARLGAAGRERVVRHFTVEAMIARVDLIYQQVLTRAK